jgi:hypothetical protein
MPNLDELFRGYFDDALSLAHKSAFAATALGTVEQEFGPEMTKLLIKYRDQFIGAILAENIESKNMQNIVFSALALIDIASKMCVRSPTLAAGMMQINFDLNEKRRKQLSAIGNAARREKFAMMKAAVEQCARSIRAKNGKLTANAIAGSAEMHRVIETAVAESGGQIALPKQKTVYSWVCAVLPPAGRRKKSSGAGGL